MLDQKNLLQWACDAHLLVAATGCYNYQLARVKVPTELNIPYWMALCVNYYDKLLLEYLEYAFPLCVNRDSFVIIKLPICMSFCMMLMHTLIKNFKIGPLLVLVWSSPLKSIIHQCCQGQKLRTLDASLLILVILEVKQSMIIFQMKFMMGYCIP